MAMVVQQLPQNYLEWTTSLEGLPTWSEGLARFDSSRRTLVLRLTNAYLCERSAEVADSYPATEHDDDERVDAADLCRHPDCQVIVLQEPFPGEDFCEMWLSPCRTACPSAVGIRLVALEEEFDLRLSMSALVPRTS